MRTVIDLRRPGAKQVVPASRNGNLRVRQIPLVSLKAGAKLVTGLPNRKIAWMLCTLLRNADKKFLEYYFRNTESIAKMYVTMVENSQAQIRTIFKIFSARENYPVLIHCVAGKDRTGVVIALLREVIGRPREETIADYAKSEGFLMEMIALPEIKNLKHNRTMVLLGPQTIRSPPDAIRIFLETLDKKYGSIDQFLTERCKVKPEHLDSIRDIFKSDHVEL